MKKTMKLSKLETKVFNTLKVGRDTPIADMHAVAYPASHSSDLEARVMQQRLGSVITRINDKLDGGRITPGKLKQTYRLERIKRDG